MDHRNLVYMSKHMLQKKIRISLTENFPLKFIVLVGLVAVQVPPLIHG